MKFAYLVEPPFNFTSPKGRVTGCDVEVARHLCAQLGIDGFAPVETTFCDLLPGVASGRWRMTTGVFNTVERRKLVRFSRPLWALPDGLLVCQGNPLHLSGYTSVARTPKARLAVIRGQAQHHAARHAGIPDARITLFDTYPEAADAVRRGQVDVYASVGRAHSGFLAQHAGWALECIPVSATEKPPGVGCFAFAPADDAFRRAIDDVLSAYLGSKDHRRMVAGFGFSDADVDLCLASQTGG